MYLIVTNKGDETFSGASVRFDGVQYEFPPGARVTIPADAARHIFGFGQDDKTNIFARHGWLSNSHDREKGMTMLGKFSFSAARETISEDVPLLEQQEHVNEQEQGSAPLLTETGDESKDESPEEVIEKSGGSMLDILSGGK